MSGYRCPLGTLLPDRPDAEEVKRDGWREHGILVVAADDDRLHWTEQETLQRIGERLYGKRVGS